MPQNSEEPGYLVRLLQLGGKVLGAYLGFLLVLALVMRSFYLGNDRPVHLVTALVNQLKPEVFSNCETGMYIWMLDEAAFWSIPLLVLWGWLLPRRIFLPFLVLYTISFVLFAWDGISCWDAPRMCP